MEVDYDLPDIELQKVYESLAERARLLETAVYESRKNMSKVKEHNKSKLKMRTLRTQARKNKRNRNLETTLARSVLRASLRGKPRLSNNTFLKSVPFFHNLEESDLLAVCDALKLMTFEQDEVIIREDDPGDLMYLIQDGKVEIYKSEFQSENQGVSLGKMVNELIGGDYFGEKSLISGKRRSATAVAVTPVTCLTLHKDVFLKYFHNNSSEVEAATNKTAFSYASEEVSSFAKHVNNYDCLLSLKRNASTVREERVATALMQLMTAFAPELNVQDTIERMTNTLYSIFMCERISLYYCHWEQRELRLHIGKTKLTLPINQGIAGHCAVTNKLVNVPHVNKNEHFYGDVDIEHGFTTRNVLCSPVCNPSGKVIAVLQLINKRGGAPFSEDDEHVIKSVSEQMSLTLASQKMEEENNHSLTNYIPLWKLDKERVSILIKRFLGTSLPKTIPSEMVQVSVSIFYAGEALAETEWIREKAERTIPYMVVKFDQRVELGIDLSNIPRVARVIFNVSYVEGDMNIPIGWAGCHLFDFDQLLITGYLRLSLFQGECTPDIAAVASLLNDTTRPEVDFLELEFPEFEKPVIYTDYVPEEAEVDFFQEDRMNRSRIYRMVNKEISSFIEQDPLKPLSHDQKLLIVQTRSALITNPMALPKFLRCIDWSDRASIQLAYRALNRWATTSDPVVALQLLNYHFPDPKIRALAVSRLESLSDATLQLYMLQLTQTLKFERFVDSALSRFLLRRALKSPNTTGQRFFWYLKAEMHVKEVQDRYGLYLNTYIRQCSSLRRVELGHQMFLVSKLESLSKSLAKLRQKERTHALQASLNDLVLPAKFQLPLNQDRWCKGLDIARARVMNSKKAPLMLDFLSTNATSPPTRVLFKAGDDLRQDQLTLQVLSVMDQLWKAEGLDMLLSVYGCISTGKDLGFLEVVPNAETLAKITAGTGKNKFSKAVQVFDDKKLKKWLGSHGISRKETEQNFCYSCAGYCVATYVLGIGDRHNDNIMLTKDGRLFHIDFGHFLGNFKSKLGVKRERSPFIFTPAMAAILGKKTTQGFIQAVYSTLRAGVQYSSKKRQPVNYTVLSHAFMRYSRASKAPRYRLDSRKADA
uniref:Phosphatidylinositol 3-kinase n=1 Tax=Mucochytrium quahogii TaxID=96639 RepID=A0A7S2SPD8_9STRA